jgi:hypothetical protein
MQCPECGAPHTEQDLFCGECGAVLDTFDAPAYPGEAILDLGPAPDRLAGVPARAPTTPGDVGSPSPVPC